MCEMCGLVFLTMYFFPTVLAVVRHKRSSVAIFALNLLLGWTVVGWVIALVWALMSDPEPEYIHVHHTAYYPYTPQPPSFGFGPRIRANVDPPRGPDPRRIDRDRPPKA